MDSWTSAASASLCSLLSNAFELEKFKNGIKDKLKEVSSKVKTNNYLLRHVTSLNFISLWERWKWSLLVQFYLVLENQFNYLTSSILGGYWLQNIVLFCSWTNLILGVLDSVYTFFKICLISCYAFFRSDLSQSQLSDRLFSKKKIVHKWN